MMYNSNPVYYDVFIISEQNVNNRALNMNISA